MAYSNGSALETHTHTHTMDTKKENNANKKNVIAKKATQEKSTTQTRGINSFSFWTPKKSDAVSPKFEIMANKFHVKNGQQPDTHTHK